MSYTITKEIEKISKEALAIMTKRHYPKYSCSCLFEDLNKNHDKDDVIKALAFLGIEGFIRINSDLGDHVSLKSFELMNNGEPIKHTMIDSYPDSATFGVIYYDPDSIFKKPITCYEHLEESVKQTKLIIDPNCEKCVSQYLQMICYEHNHSLVFCGKCKAKGFLNKMEIQKRSIKPDVLIEEILKKHNIDYWGI